MYLTRMFLNTRRRTAGRLVESPQRMHAAVASAFSPDTHAAERSRALWRIDRQGDSLALIVVSPTEPDLTHLVEQAGWQTGEMWQTRPYSSMLTSLTAGQVWGFRLTANPTYSGRKEGWADTKPRACTTVDQQQEWLLSRCPRMGFAVRPGVADAWQLRIIERRTLRFPRDGKPVTISTAAYEGILEVSDADALRHALVNGIGRAKAYGCGLLTLAPVAST